MKSIIDAIKNDDLVGLESILSDELHQRAADAVQIIRPVIMAKFTGQEVQEEEATIEEALEEILNELEDVTGVEMTEQELTELSRNTLATYANRAANHRVRLSQDLQKVSKAEDDINSARHAADIHGSAASDAFDAAKSHIRNKRDQLRNTERRRERGFYKAIKRLAKEELGEMIELGYNTLLELDHDTYHSYLKKSADGLAHHRYKEVEGMMTDGPQGAKQQKHHGARADKRMKGIQRAARMMRNVMR